VVRVAPGTGEGSMSVTFVHHYAVTAVEMG
jgi:hypothetical protein